jgi:hypothetical protein
MAQGHSRSFRCRKGGAPLTAFGKAASTAPAQSWPMFGLLHRQRLQRAALIVSSLGALLLALLAAAPPAV